MLKVRIIPTLLWKNFGLVKGIGFDSWRRVGPVLPAIKVYNLRQVDELILVDITATKENREPDYDEIANFSKECFVPLTVGGGIKNIDHVKKILRAGADKVCVNTSLFQNPKLVSQIAEKFGTQCVVASIDAKKIGKKYFSFSQSGSKKSAVDPVDLALKAEKLGAGEILITSVDLDGTMKGYDLELVKNVSQTVHIPVIASGGAGNYEDMWKAVKSGANAVAAASIFHYTEQTPLEAKQYLKGKGVPTRI